MVAKTRQNHFSAQARTVVSRCVSCATDIQAIVRITMTKIKAYALHVCSFFVTHLVFEEFKFELNGLLSKILVKRPPKETIRTLLLAQSSNYGSRFIEYLFGNQVAGLYKTFPHDKVVEIVSIALAGSFYFIFVSSLKSHVALIT